VTDEIYTQDGDYIKDIEINDLRNRYTLTKGATQKLVNIHLFIATDAPAGLLTLLLGESHACCLTVVWKLTDSLQPIPFCIC
jgi:hypothetical protein